MERFMQLMHKYAAQVSIYLCRKTKMYFKAFSARHLWNSGERAKWRLDEVQPAD